VTLPELVGKNNAELIFYTSRRVTGEEATRMGLANECVPQDQVRERAMRLAQEIAECSPPPITNSPNRRGCAPPEDFKEGVKATEERRIANFRGR
jgi:enoyl-CoA hydratase/carnithine racemase